MFERNRFFRTILIGTLPLVVAVYFGGSQGFAYIVDINLTDLFKESKIVVKATIVDEEFVDVEYMGILRHVITEESDSDTNIGTAVELYKTEVLKKESQHFAFALVEEVYKGPAIVGETLRIHTTSDFACYNSDAASNGESAFMLLIPMSDSLLEAKVSELYGMNSVFRLGHAGWGYFPIVKRDDLTCVTLQSPVILDKIKFNKYKLEDEDLAWEDEGACLKLSYMEKYFKEVGSR